MAHYAENGVLVSLYRHNELSSVYLISCKYFEEVCKFRTGLVGFGRHSPVMCVESEIFVSHSLQQSLGEVLKHFAVCFCIDLPLERP